MQLSRDRLEKGGKDERESLQGGKVTSNDVLLSLDVVAANERKSQFQALHPRGSPSSLDDLDEDVAATSDGLNDLTKSSVSEALADPRGVDSDHGVGRAVLVITLDGALHGDSTVEDDVDEGRDGEDVGDRGEGGVLSKRVTGEDAVVLDESLGAHVFESGLWEKKSARGEEKAKDETTNLLGDDEGDLSEMGRVEETSGRRESVTRSAEVDVAEERERLDVAVLVGCRVG
jgi:hypothetical protein